jgi:hypothetical protein
MRAPPPPKKNARVLDQKKNFLNSPRPFLVCASTHNLSGFCLSHPVCAAAKKLLCVSFEPVDLCEKGQLWSLGASMQFSDGAATFVRISFHK